MEKFLLVIDAADDAAMFPVSGLRAVTCAGDGAVLLQFAPGIHDPTGTDADADLVTLTVLLILKKQLCLLLVEQSTDKEIQMTAFLLFVMTLTLYSYIQTFYLVLLRLTLYNS